jgi:hypothetical protein
LECKKCPRGISYYIKNPAAWQPCSILCVKARSHQSNDWIAPSPHEIWVNLFKIRMLVHYPQVAAAAAAAARGQRQQSLRMHHNPFSRTKQRSYLKYAQGGFFIALINSLQ